MPQLQELQSQEHRSQEIVLATLPGSNSGERVLMVLKNRVGEESRVEMRQQTWCEQIGWYTQSSIGMEPQQVAALRNALGQTATVSSGPRHFSRLRKPGFEPRVVHADSA